MYYVGILEGAKNNWGVRIPDLVGCHGAGSSAEEAAADAISAAREWAEYQTARGVTLPTPRGMAEIIADTEAEFDATAGGEPIGSPFARKLTERSEVNFHHKGHWIGSTVLVIAIGWVKCKSQFRPRRH